ncbi:MAG: NAD(P)(+) transhydrogenase (Re/Si-specific) subunit alpha, partial [Deltaproteobacteria bacterium]|nr:NAD(P)(+) transhydrogenase (Re/Si-specific) subunit alpha [Deltaproteobacteria bacterium]
MRIGVPKENHPGERRIATTPEVADVIKKLGYEVAIESGAGLEAKFTDDSYRNCAVQVVEDAKTLYDQSDIILKVRAPESSPESDLDELDLLREGQVLISFIQPGQNQELMSKLSEKKVSVLAMDSIPRISRAQKMDAL